VSAAGITPAHPTPEQEDELRADVRVAITDRLGQSVASLMGYHDVSIGTAMTASTTALVIAIVGVCGTLFAPIVSQTLSKRARREEFELQRKQLEDEYERDHLKESMAAKRNCYLSAMLSGRRYRQELMNHLYVVNRDGTNGAASEQLEDARHAYNSSFAELQLTGTQPVVQAMEPVRVRLSRSYEGIKNIEESRPEPGQSFDEIKKSLLMIWDYDWPAVITAMRADLGIND
jgi:hypothetical protein